ncbi:MAG: protein kinase domain-containing protein, partial [Planctomycetota bacterium]
MARGGMGHVYRAIDTMLNAPVAIKTIRPGVASDPAALRRFRLEVLLARSISHPNLCQVYDLWHDGGSDVSFLSMEFLDGETLTDRIESEGALDPEEAQSLLCQMTSALDAAHRAGIVHRDFKSANVMVVAGDDGERVVVTDFGLAINVDTEGGPQPDEIAGTPAYMAPEQVRGETVQPASDLYALGVVLFEMCTGRLPFLGPTGLAIAQQHVSKDPPRPSSIVDLDHKWDDAILRLLAKDPSDRYRTAGDVRHAIDGTSGSDAAHPHALPGERNVFIGRRVELERLDTVLEGGATRLLTLVGPGGVGKTRLALHYGWSRLPRWGGGVWFCDLSEVGSVDGVARAVATSLDVSLGREDPIVQLGHAIAGRGRTLLIMDNVESASPAIRTVLEQWIDRAPDARILATSRTSIGVDSESVQALGVLPPESAVELFLRRAREHHPELPIRDQDADRVDAIVRRLSGGPLAIELAAARLRSVNLDALLEDLQDRVPPPTTDDGGETLSAILEWSWSLLEPWERSAAAQTSIFDGGFTLEAAEAVIDLATFEASPATSSVVQSLVTKNLLLARVVAGAPRFSAYAAVRAFTATKLDHATGAAAVARHGAFYAAFKHPEAPAVSVGRQASLRRLMEVEIGNFVVACRRAIDRLDEETVAATYSSAATVLHRQGPLRAAVDLGVAALASLSRADMRAEALRVLGMSERLAGRFEDARAHMELALALAREVGDRRMETGLLCQLGYVCRYCGSFEEALECAETALSMAQDDGNR